ncbi:hypothetical protein Ms3S1_36160 [Methylosinus sp. 3S-1]|uniref:von Hippel-Lindau disease tumour suppressor beta domain-containing protein n=2 Tax=Methylocystaceae TaxID=31993 RepID=A0A2D2D430_METT3|nr:hypothetical protein CQW49_18305 [Methylosinus trichosporium OB3b]OBS52014.1 hypothetical protein A8B73_13240 [Methylosinus sp. 3S-1]
MKMLLAAIAATAMLGCASAAVAMPNDPDTTPGDGYFCDKYASSTKRFVDGVLARKPSCLDYGKGVHADYQMHFSWCQRTPRTEVEGAARHIRDLGRQCVGVGRGGNFRGPDIGGHNGGGSFGAGCPAPGSVRSANSSQPTVIQFANSTFRTLKIYWLDFNGQPKFYRELKHGQDYRQPTYMTHPWIAVDARGNCVDGVLKASRPGDNLIELFGDVRN